MFRCSHPDIINDTFTLNASAYFNDSITFDKCSYYVNDTKHKCNNWVFDKTYYKSSLTEEVFNLFLFKTKIRFFNYFPCLVEHGM